MTLVSTLFWHVDILRVMKRRRSWRKRAVASDQKRDAYMNSIGLRVLRFTNREILENTNSVLGVIRGYCLSEQHKNMASGD